MKEYHQLWKENSESFPPELPQLVRAAPVERHHALMSPIERQREKHTVLKDKTSVRGLLRGLQRYLLTRQANDSMEGVIKSLKKLVDRQNEISREIDSKFFFESVSFFNCSDHILFPFREEAYCRGLGLLNTCLSQS